MPQTDEKPLRMGVLHKEHALLGARFGKPFDSDYLVVDGYGEEGSDPEEKPGAWLFDLTGCTYTLLTGKDAPALAEAALCGKRLAVGQCAFEPALTGDAALTSVSLVVRTGDEEYVFLDPTQRGGMLTGWVQIISDIEQDGFAPYADSRLEEADGMLVPLLLAGPEAQRVLSDYLAKGVKLPAKGRVESVKMDAIETVIAQLPCKPSCFLVLVPVDYACTIWRSLLSFTEVCPAGRQKLLELGAEALPWIKAFLAFPGSTMRPPRSTLEMWGVIRDDGGFVGQRALS